MDYLFHLQLLEFTVFKSKLFNGINQNFENHIILSSTSNPITNVGEIDKELESIIQTINSSIEYSTETITFKSKPINAKPIPQLLHNQFLISTMKKTFNTIRFLLSTKNNIQKKKTFNTKNCWKLENHFPAFFALPLLAINFCVECIYFIFNFCVEKKSFCAERFEIVLNDEKIANAFGENLEKIFNCEVKIMHSESTVNLPRDLPSRYHETH
ncbi:hypothetical protein BpHYR1_017648 [Brachionus plicatilis]|uniref:Uncharacterized protein n=1 Tax=Brachionus plicatilis TaxID=10195 RepID=A0A3M7PZN7_BRAPC|nr:hypothetical protein BpHYR1_017648 [Brachionus plicatilis]